MNQEIFDKVVELMTEYLTPQWVEDSKVTFTPETTFEYLQTDILDEVEISIMVEEHFGIEQIPNDLEWFNTVGELAEYVEESTTINNG